MSTRAGAAMRELAVGESVTLAVSPRERYGQTGLAVAAGARYAFRAGGKWRDWTRLCGPEGWGSGLLTRLGRLRGRPFFLLCGTVGRDDGNACPIQSRHPSAARRAVEVAPVPAVDLGSAGAEAVAGRAADAIDGAYRALGRRHDVHAGVDYALVRIEAGEGRVVRHREFFFERVLKDLPRLPQPIRVVCREASPALLRYVSGLNQLTARRLYDMVCERGYAGQASHFRFLVSSMRPRPPAEAYLRLRKVEGLGMGDVKMLATTGAFMGLHGTLQTLVLASLAGSVIGLVYIKLTKQDYSSYQLPLGTFLGATAIVIALFQGPLRA